MLYEVITEPAAYIILPVSVSTTCRVAGMLKIPLDTLNFHDYICAEHSFTPSWPSSQESPTKICINTRYEKANFAIRCRRSAIPVRRLSYNFV